jgi:hypothetical protein
MRVAIRVSADAEPWDEMVTYAQEEEVNHEQRG